MNNNGVTILQVVITVIIMIIILAVSIYLGPNVANEAKLASIYNEIKEINSVFKEMKILGEITFNGENLSFYKEIEARKVDPTNHKAELGENPSGDFYYLDFKSSKNLENVLGLERVKNDYILKYDDFNLYLVGGVTIMDENRKAVIKYDSDEIINYYSDTFVK